MSRVSLSTRKLSVWPTNDDGLIDFAVRTMEGVLGTGVFNSDGDMWQFHRKSRYASQRTRTDLVNVCGSHEAFFRKGTGYRLWDI